MNHTRLSVFALWGPFYTKRLDLRLRCVTLISLVVWCKLGILKLYLCDVAIADSQTMQRVTTCVTLENVLILHIHPRFEPILLHVMRVQVMIKSFYRLNFTYFLKYSPMYMDSLMIYNS